MFDPNTLKNIKDIEEAVRMANSLSGFPISELTHSAAHLASTANHIGIQNIAAVEEATRVAEMRCFIRELLLTFSLSSTTCNSAWVSRGFSVIKHV